MGAFGQQTLRSSSVMASQQPSRSQLARAQMHSPEPTSTFRPVAPKGDVAAQAKEPDDANDDTSQATREFVSPAAAQSLSPLSSECQAPRGSKNFAQQLLTNH